MYDTLRKLLRTDEFTVEEQFEILGRHPRHGAIPRFLFNSGVGHHLQEQAERHGWQEPLWSHQAQALNALGRGENVVLSTGTAFRQESCIPVDRVPQVAAKPWKPSARVLSA